MKRKLYMLATDLDGTLVGDKMALQNLLNYYDKSLPDIALVYITGRHYQSALSLIDSEALPRPDILITDLGTAIYTSSLLTLDKDWQKEMYSKWQPNDIIEISKDFPSLKRQSLPSTDRISFTVNNDSKVARDLGVSLSEKNIPHKLVYSSNRDVDILPVNSGKGNALIYVLKNFASKEVQLLVAGDSGNDLEMLSLGYPSVVVGNAQPELTDIKVHDKLFMATQNYAAGIQEAWVHFYESNNVEVPL